MHQTSNLSYLTYIRNSGISSFLQNSANNLYNNNQTSKDILISDIKNLKELRNYIYNLNQNISKRFNNTAVLGRGNPNAKFMIIGDPPSNDENIAGKNFSGDSEVLLSKMLTAININFKDVYLTNIIPWQISESKDPTNDEILKCLPFIQRYIEFVQPKIIILLGFVAAKAILNSNLPFAELRGKWHKYNSIHIEQPIDCIVSYNPYFLLTSPSHKKYSWEDLQNINQKIIDENI